VVTIGVDFALIFLTEIALPMLFAAIDTLMCLIDYFKPSGWSEQLECVEMTCFKGPDAAADVATFFSMNIIIGRFAAIMDATLNSRSGKRFFKAPKTGAVSSKGRTKDPISGKPIDNAEPESASMGNPMYDFDFAGAWDDFSGTTASDQCSKCFVCKASLPARPAPPGRPPHSTDSSSRLWVALRAGARAAPRVVAHCLHRLALVAVQLCHVRGQRHRQLPDQRQLVH
jgi:hypothetical protein